MLRTVPPLPWFVVQITAALGGDEYSFLEVWLSEDAWQEKIGGRYGTEENPGVALEGVSFAVDDYALCRSSEGEGGSKWELFPFASGGAGGGSGACAKFAALDETSILKLAVESVGTGRCSSIDDTQEIYLEWDEVNA